MNDETFEDLKRRLNKAKQAAVSVYNPMPPASVIEYKGEPPTADLKTNKAALKPSWALLPFAALTGVLRVFAYGSKKYALGNWRKASVSDGAGGRYISACIRHLSSMQHPDGTVDAASLNALDDESGLPHIDHAICGLIMLRGILVKDGVLAEDPGVGKAPPK